MTAVTSSDADALIAAAQAGADDADRKAAADYCRAAAKYLRMHAPLPSHPTGAVWQLVLAALLRHPWPYDAMAYDAVADRIEEQGRRNHRIARIALAIQRGGGDHLGDVASIHADFIELIKELKELRHEPA